MLIAVCVLKDLNANNLPDVIFGHELQLRGERKSTGHAKNKGDRLFNRDEALSAWVSAAYLKLQSTLAGRSLRYKFMTELTAPVRTRIFPVQLFDIEFRRRQRLLPAAALGAHQIPVVRRVAAPLPQPAPQQAGTPLHDLQRALHQSPSAHCVAMYGVSYRTGSFFLLKMMYHCTTASPSSTRIITAKTAVTAASSR